MLDIFDSQIDDCDESLEVERKPFDIITTFTLVQFSVPLLLIILEPHVTNEFRKSSPPIPATRTRSMRWCLIDDILSSITWLIRCMLCLFNQV